MPVGPYWYENLGEDGFQKRCQAIVTGKYDQVTCYPVGQKDGGRDITQKTDTGSVVYQVKWSKDSVKNPATWLENAIAGESENIRARVAAGATRYVLMTSISGTGAAATHPDGRGAGTIEKLETTIAGYAEDYKLESMECWWRDDIDALVAALPASTLWRFQRMLAGPEAVRFLIHADHAEFAETRLAAMIEKVVQAQWWRDTKVKLKQAELERDDLEDLFVDVKTNPNPTRQNSHPGRMSLVRTRSARRSILSNPTVRLRWYAASPVKGNLLWHSTSRRSIVRSSFPTNRARQSSDQV